MRILVVDDNGNDRRVLRKILESQDYEVIEAENGEEALSIARKSPPDVIITDVLMPKMDGFSLCKEWMKDRALRKIPFIFYSATYDDEEDIKLGLSMGASAYIVKPEEPKAFFEKIEEAIEKAKSGELANREVKLNLEKYVIFLERYNQRLVKKLEDKIMQLENVKKELEKKNKEKEVEIWKLRTITRAAIDRELVMIELKKRIKELENEIERLRRENENLRKKLGEIGIENKGNGD